MPSDSTYPKTTTIEATEKGENNLGTSFAIALLWLKFGYGHKIKHSLRPQRDLQLQVGRTAFPRECCLWKSEPDGNCPLALTAAVMKFVAWKKHTTALLGLLGAGTYLPTYPKFGKFLFSFFLSGVAGIQLLGPQTVKVKPLLVSGNPRCKLTENMISYWLLLNKVWRLMKGRFSPVVVWKGIGNECLNTTGSIFSTTLSCCKFIPIKLILDGFHWTSLETTVREALYQQRFPIKLFQSTVYISQFFDNTSVIW